MPAPTPGLWGPLRLCLDVFESVWAPLVVLRADGHRLTVAVLVVVEEESWGFEGASVKRYPETTT